MTVGNDKTPSHRCKNQGIHRVTVDSEDHWYCGTHVKPLKAFKNTPAEFCSEEDHVICEGMRKSVFSHGVGDTLHQRGGHEVVIVWDEVVKWTDQIQQTGERTNGTGTTLSPWIYKDRRVVIRCKARIDKLITEGHAITLDAKSCMMGKANPRNCRQAINEWGYIFQGSMYRSGINNLSCVTEEPVHDLPDDLLTDLIWLFVEKSEPFDVCVMQADPLDLDIGEREYKAALLKYAKCQLSGDWPGGNPETIWPCLPEYRRKQGERNVG
jgi:hypothetical protein